MVSIFIHFGLHQNTHTNPLSLFFHTHTHTHISKHTHTHETLSLSLSLSLFFLLNTQQQTHIGTHRQTNKIVNLPSLFPVRDDRKKSIVETKCLSQFLEKKIQLDNLYSTSTFPFNSAFFKKSSLH